ncbi:hypothetical protein BAE44_0007334 [Dichanthelium oligosanthes]|uniref:HTH 3-helical bundle domain-containing protein n=1 Tax=Dichanthelium oligosanthes TaxID=888268 RepID=A0A1E5W2U8_9POAL|nr:hypothetical protein BAE44_0007334 [Dichanthelium oligosanthes]
MFNDEWSASDVRMVKSLIASQNANNYVDDTNKKPNAIVDEIHARFLWKKRRQKNSSNWEALAFAAGGAYNPNYYGSGGQHAPMNNLAQVWSPILTVLARRAAANHFEWTAYGGYFFCSSSTGGDWKPDGLDW